MDAGAKLVTIVPIIPVVIIVAAFWHHPWTPVRMAGLVTFLVSFVLLTITRVQLGNSFSVTPQAKKLVTHGIYSKLRHPVYIFSALFIFGIALYINMPLLLLLFVILIPIQVARARGEEKVLEEKFGAEYADYKRSTLF
jgi:protein-S-isoprenylcysteine O-methyltransferase Ste14